MAECKHGLEESWCDTCNPREDLFPAEEIPTWSRGISPTRKEKGWRPQTHFLSLGKDIPLSEIPKSLQAVHIANSRWTSFTQIKKLLSHCHDLKTLTAPKSLYESICVYPPTLALLGSKGITLSIGYEKLGAGATVEESHRREEFQKTRRMLLSLNLEERGRLSWLQALGLEEAQRFSRYYCLRGEPPISLGTLSLEWGKRTIYDENEGILHFLSPKFPKPRHGTTGAALLNLLQRAWEHQFTAEEIMAAPKGLTKPALFKHILAQRVRSQGRK